MHLRYPIALIAAAAAIGCAADGMTAAEPWSVPLAELDMRGPAPGAIALAGPDRVLVSEGARFSITVDEGSAAAQELRFRIRDGMLWIGRRDGDWTSFQETATVRVVLPAAPRRLTVAGSGEMVSEALADAASVAISGSGTLETPQVMADELAVSISGSGTYRAAGRARLLDLDLAGSGEAQLAGLRVERAAVSVAGAGDAAFASDGEVTGAIAGSGDVRVSGRARCDVAVAGSGEIRCGA